MSIITMNEPEIGKYLPNLEGGYMRNVTENESTKSGAYNKNFHCRVNSISSSYGTSECKHVEERFIKK